VTRRRFDNVRPIVRERLAALDSGPFNVLRVSVILAREDPREAFVSTAAKSLDSLPVGARLGTSSLRRQCQVRAAFPHLVIEDLRALVGFPDGSEAYCAEARAPVGEAQAIGLRVAEELIAKGAGGVMEQLGIAHDANG